MTHLKRIGFTFYPVRDLIRARDFYENTLGLKPGYVNDTWQEYDLGDTTFAIDSDPLEIMAPGSQTSAAFEVADLRSLVEVLRTKGVPFVQLKGGDIMETPVCLMTFIKDPDGNVLTLHQLKE